MADPEKIERVRQEIMRFRELLHIMRQKLEAGERAYAQLFSNCSPEDMKALKEKDLQKMVALQIIDDLTPLRKAVMQTRYDARSLEQAFEELDDIVAATQYPDLDDEA